MKASYYDRDYYAWTREQIALLRERAWDELDTANLIEELLLLEGGVVSELDNRLTVLCEHLLKLDVARQDLPRDYTRASQGWRRTCTEQRKRLARLLRKNPSLRRELPETLAESYDLARSPAAAGLALDEEAMPATCPWTLEQVLDHTFWPDEDVSHGQAVQS